MDELNELRGSIQRLEDREQIRDVLYAYTRHMDRLNAGGVKEGYHPDAVDMHWGTFVGNAHEFADYMTDELRAVEFVTHEVSNPIIELDGDRAFVESRYTSRVRIGIDEAERGRWVEMLTHGRYLDVFERRDGKWKIAHRRLAQDGGRVELVTDLSTMKPGAAALCWPDDLVYHGFDITSLEWEKQDPVPGRFAALVEYGRRALAAEARLSPPDDSAH